MALTEAERFALAVSAMALTGRGDEAVKLVEAHAALVAPAGALAARALGDAISMKNDALTLRLVDAGAPLDIKGESPLYAAARAGALGATEFLLSRGARAGASDAIPAAIDGNHYDVAIAILNAVDPHGVLHGREAVNAGCAAIAANYLRAANPVGDELDDLLAEAIRHAGDVETAKLLLARGANPHGLVKADYEDAAKSGRVGALREVLIARKSAPVPSAMQVRPGAARSIAVAITEATPPQHKEAMLRMLLEVGALIPQTVMIHAAKAGAVELVRDLMPCVGVCDALGAAIRARSPALAREALQRGDIYPPAPADPAEMESEDEDESNSITESIIDHLVDYDHAELFSIVMPRLRLTPDVLQAGVQGALELGRPVALRALAAAGARLGEIEGEVYRDAVADGHTAMALSIIESMGV